MQTYLFSTIKDLIKQAQQQVVRNVNTMMVLTYYEIGRLIVQHEQQGEQRAEYGKETLTELSNALTEEFGKGYSYANLKYMRQFYTTYQNRIRQSLIGEFQISNPKENTISQSVIVKSEPQSSELLFTLSWTHYIQLLKIENDDERRFYEIEATQQNWSVRELQRQYQSSLYERLALSRDKSGVQQLAQKGQVMENPVDALKSPFVLEFLGLKEEHHYSESDLETAIIDKLEHFLLELGKGFLFDGRQKRFTFEGDSFYIDLVFYNRLLRCFVLIDLKIGKLTHQDIGQMQMYVNYYDRMVKTDNETPTIGIILCKEENKTVVEFTLPKDNNQIFSREYKLYLPSKEQLKRQLESVTGTNSETEK